MNKVVDEVRKCGVVAESFEIDFYGGLVQKRINPIRNTNATGERPETR